MTWDPDGFRRALRGKNEGVKIDVFASRVDGERVLDLAMLVVPARKRGQGVGTRVVKAITDYADEHGAIVILTPDPDTWTRAEMLRLQMQYEDYVRRVHGTDVMTFTEWHDRTTRTRARNRLVRWYKSFGFVENKGRRADYRLSAAMYRLPRRTG